MFHISEMTEANGFVRDYQDRHGSLAFRQKKPIGNWHVWFYNGAGWGQGHWDKYNGAGPVGDQVNHLTKWVGEQFGVNETGGKILTGIAAGLIARQLLK